MASSIQTRARPVAVPFLIAFLSGAVPSVAVAATLAFRGETCAANPSAAGCEPLARWCQDDRVVETDPAACKFAHGRSLKPLDEAALEADCKAKPADGDCAVLLEVCSGDEPSSLRPLCRDARRWSEPPPPPPPPRRERDEEEDDDVREVVVRRDAPMGLDLGLGGWSADGDTLGAVELGYDLHLVGSLAIELTGHLAMPLDFGSAYVRGQGALRYTLWLGGLGLRVAGGAGWDGTVMGNTPRAPGDAWALAAAGVTLPLGGCLELCDLDDVNVALGVNGEARYVLGTGTRSRPNRFSDFDDTILEVWLSLPLPMRPRVALRSASLFTSASWTGFFLTLAL